MNLVEVLLPVRYEYGEGGRSLGMQNLTNLEKDFEFCFSGEPLKTLRPETDLYFKEVFMTTIREWTRRIKDQK